MNCHCCSCKCRKSGSYRNKNRVVQRYACDRCGKSFSQSQPLGELRVDFKVACQVVHLLVEGMGIRAISRFTGLHQETVLNILKEAGDKAAQWHETDVRNVKAEVVQADEMHAIVGCRQQTAYAWETERGAQFTFLSVDRHSKLIINYLVGKRTRENAEHFLMDLRGRVAGHFQIVTDNWQVYSGEAGAVALVLGSVADYATETKYFARPNEFEPRKVIGIRRRPRFGEPDMTQATTCHVERTNLSVRLFTKRFARCTLGYSKKLDNLKSAVALFVWHFNWVRIHGSLNGRTPAMAAGLYWRPLTIAELLG
jgi:IS1 family transposase/transposase-like protein